MKKWLKITLIVVFAPLALGIPITIVSLIFAKDPPSEKVVAVKTFGEMNLDEKKIAINELINNENYKEQYAKLNNAITDGVTSGVKYPETLEILFKNEEWVKPENFILLPVNFKILDYEKGELYVMVDFRSENSYSMKTRNRIIFKIKFNGSKDFELLDAKLE